MRRCDSQGDFSIIWIVFLSSAKLYQTFINTEPAAPVCSCHLSGISRDQLNSMANFHWQWTLEHLLVACIMLHFKKRAFPKLRGCPSSLEKWLAFRWDADATDRKAERINSSHWVAPSILENWPSLKETGYFGEHTLKMANIFSTLSLHIQGVFFNCSAQISVLKRKTMFNQRGPFVHREFHGTESMAAHRFSFW